MGTNTNLSEKAQGLHALVSEGTKGGSMLGGRSNGERSRQDLERESIDFFVSFVQVLGLPKSIGQIYGLLFVSIEALPMDEVIARLGISKGSVSQGLGLLKSLGAVTSHYFPPDRREHFRADLNVSRIVTHFFENRLQPRLEHGDGRLQSMLRLAKTMDAGADSEASATILNRIQALQKWQKRGRRVVPMMIRWLKR